MIRLARGLLEAFGRAMAQFADAGRPSPSRAERRHPGARR